MNNIRYANDTVIMANNLKGLQQLMTSVKARGDELATTIKASKLNYLDHIMRNERRYGLLQNVLQGRIPGKRGPGRRRNSGLENLRM
ncbi:hypothetical protein Trydic_g1315 [Trypoxylus dichotomus]